jgi:2-polyprenyl-6-methoxyphenol hydroxylase-like FAD-dependent oxidoreductase
VSLFVSVPVTEAEAVRREGLAAFRERVLRVAPMAEPILEQLPSTEALLFAGYRDVVFKQWHAGNVVFIGDAAHATSPQLGQGSNLALVDALVLSECIAAQPGNVELALMNYSERRRAHLGFYQRMTRWLTPFFQSHSTLLGLVRDLGFPIGARLPFLREQMVATMCGGKLGFLRGSLPAGLHVPRLPARRARLRSPLDSAGCAHVRSARGHGGPAQLDRLGIGRESATTTTPRGCWR